MKAAERCSPQRPFPTRVPPRLVYLYSVFQVAPQCPELPRFAPESLAGEWMLVSVEASSCVRVLILKLVQTCTILFYSSQCTLNLLRLCLQCRHEPQSMTHTYPVLIQIKPKLSRFSLHKDPFLALRRRWLSRIPQACVCRAATRHGESSSYSQVWY